MNAMTEDDARKTICWRTLFAERGSLPGPGTVGPPLITRGGDCIASECMAWRWDYEYRITNKQTIDDPGDPDLDSQGWEMHGESSVQKFWRRPIGGFCGLAEPRVVDVEITQ